MRRPSPTAIATAVLAGIAGVAGSFLAAGPTPGFVGTSVGSIVVAFTPGSVVTLSITQLGDLASLLQFGTTLAASVALYAVFAFLGMRSMERPGTPWLPAVVAGAAIWLVTTLLTVAPLQAFGAAVPAALVVGLAGSDRATLDAGVDPGRRRIGALAAGVAGFGALSYALRRGGGGQVERGPLDLSPSERTVVESKLSTGRDRALDIDTESGLISEFGDFYDVDINSVLPSPDPEEWTLSVTGEVENELEFTYQDLLDRDPEHRFVTLRCVGEKLNGEKMDTALWTGIPIKPLVEEAVPKSGCECVMVRSVDNYYEEFPIEALERGMLAYGMNGDELPQLHGHPVRVLIPGHWGEISVKWVAEIEVLDREKEGFWELRGWHGTGPVKTIAKIHAVEQLEGDRVRVGGHAYAGYRGVSGVEVSTDGGQTWQEARLSEPLPVEPDWKPRAPVWRQWALDLELDGETEVTARAIEADGTIQPEKRSSPFPSGPSGWVSRTIAPD